MATPLSRTSFTLAVSTLLLCSAPAYSETNDKVRISGPYSHDNLAIFLIHGDDRLQGKKLLTLGDALRAKKVIVHETGSVGQLAIENLSNEEVFVQAGDIVKGGQQDRVLSLDVVLPPRSGRVPVDSFCVEHDRWEQRGRESARQFGSSNAALSSKKLKIAARKNRDQGEVWREVQKAQEALGDKLANDVKSHESQSSLMLTLENKDVKNATGAYKKSLASIVDDKKDVIGFAFAINGKVNSAEVFASPALFKMQWAKLLESSAVEAIAERVKDAKLPTATEGDVRQLMSTEGGTRKQQAITKDVQLNTVERGENVLFETESKGAGWIHRSYY